MLGIIEHKRSMDIAEHTGLTTERIATHTIEHIAADIMDFVHTAIESSIIMAIELEQLPIMVVLSIM